GAGLLLQPTGQHVLAKLGVIDQIIATSSPVLHLRGVNARGRVVLDVHYRDLEARRGLTQASGKPSNDGQTLCGRGITRGALHNALLSAMRTSSDKAKPVTLHEGVEIAAVRHDGAQARITTIAGQTHGPYDLVAVCDGARSKLRPAWAKSKAYRYGALWCVAQDHDNTFAGTLSQVYGSTTAMVGFLPSGNPLALDGTDKSRLAPQTVSFFWSLPTDEIAPLKASSLDDWKANVLRLAPHAQGVLDQVLSWEQMIPSPYFDAVASPCCDGPIVYLGDAGHAMSPQLGQGANLALWDSLVLSEHLAWRDTSLPSARSRPEPPPMADTLKAFSRARRDHIRYYSWASMLLTPWFQSDARALAPLRDAFMAPLTSIPWVRRQMLQSLAGIKTGIISSLPMPPRPSADLAITSASRPSPESAQLPPRGARRST
ncbi:MAG: FAD-dependent oxidoreductase, partial [Phycisphaerales bacterium]